MSETQSRQIAHVPKILLVVFRIARFNEYKVIQILQV